MERKYTFLERLTSDTPIFFKRLQIFGVALTSLGVTLTQIIGIPEKITTAAITIGAVTAAIAQFAVKQCEPTIQQHENK